MINNLSFQELADELMNQQILQVGQNQYRLCEIEIYLHSNSHPDLFTHCHQDQKTNQCLYFHRYGNEYKSGTYKGLDITYGTQDSFCGVLIRSIQNLSSKTIIEGPCNVVNEILGILKYDSIQSLVNDISKTDKISVPLPINNNKIKLFSHNHFFQQIYNSPRVGLTLQKYNDERAKYLMKPYRYIIFPNQIKKQKLGVILALYYQDKKSVDEIMSLTKTQKRFVDKYIEQSKNIDIKNTKKETYKKYSGKKLKTVELCELIGLHYYYDKN